MLLKLAGWRAERPQWPQGRERERATGDNMKLDEIQRESAQCNDVIDDAYVYTVSAKSSPFNIPNPEIHITRTEHIYQLYRGWVG